MNWSVILTTVGLFITVVVFSPFLMAIYLATCKARLKMQLEVFRKEQQMLHPSNDIDWSQFYEGEIK